MTNKFLTIVIAMMCALQISSAAQTVTVEDAKKQAIAKYPDISRKGTPLNAKFVELYNEARTSNASLLNDPNWPVILADKAAALVAKTPATPGAATPPVPPAPKPAGPPEPPPADDLPHPLGRATEAIPCGNDFNYFLYLPNSLRKGVKHPVLFVMNPGGGGAGDAERYKAGAERNRWILATSKESKNGYNGSQQAIDAMIKHVTSKLPIDQKRMYTTGFSGGSRMAFATSQVHKEIAGVIACGAGGGLGSAKQVAYGLCGSNCFNRTDMSKASIGYGHKACVLRFFPGQHDWANSELCDDAITHLNGVFLFAHRSRSDYAADYAHYIQQVRKLIDESTTPSPMRAYMWSSFLTEHKVNDPTLASVHATLSQNAMNKLYVKGLEDIAKFAQKTFGPLNAAVWKADPGASAACEREAKKYTGTPWEEVLNRMSKDAQSY